MRKFTFTKPSRKQSAGFLLAISLTTLGVMNQMLVTYQIVEGFSTKTVHSFVKDAEKAIEVAGYDIDEYTAIIEIEGASNVSRIYLAEKFDVRVYADQEMRVASVSENSVGEILAEAGIKLNQYDEVSPSLETQISQETSIIVTRVEKQLVKETVVIPFQTVQKNTDDLDKGNSRVAQTGENGEKIVTTEIIIKNGKEVSRSTINEKITKAGKQQIIENGIRGVLQLGNGVPLQYKKALNVTATAYSTEGWSNNITATGTVARVGAIAVDPKVIPLGSKLYITSSDGKSWVYGHAVAADTGGAIKGNKIDLFFNTQKECINFGRQSAIVYVL